MKIFIECDDSSYRPSRHQPSCFRKQPITAKYTKLWHKVVRLFAMFSFEIHTKVMKQNKSLWPFLWHNSLNRNIDLDDGDDKCFDVPPCLKMSIYYIFLRLESKGSLQQPNWMNFFCKFSCRKKINVDEAFYCWLSYSPGIAHLARKISLMKPLSLKPLYMYYFLLLYNKLNFLWDKTIAYM